MGKLNASLFAFIFFFTNYLQDIAAVASNKHVNVPGTRVFITPPSGFVLSNSFAGLVGSDNATILVYDVVGSSYWKNVEGFSRDSYESKGVLMFHSEWVNINGYPGRLLWVQAQPGVKNVQIVFGDATFTTLISASYPIEGYGAEDSIIESLRSIQYDKSCTIDPYKNVWFALENDASPFTFEKVSSNVYFYALPNGDDTRVTIVPLPRDAHTSPADISKIMLANMESYGMRDVKIRKRSNFLLKNRQAYEAKATCVIKGVKHTVYHFVMVHQNKAVLFQGLTATNKYVRDFKKFAHSLTIP